MVSVFLLLLVSLAVAGGVALYAAYVHRGEEVPHVPWLGEAMKRGVAALPTLDNHPRRPLEIERRAAPALQTARATAVSTARSTASTARSTARSTASTARSTAKALRDRVPAQR